MDEYEESLKRLAILKQKVQESRKLALERQKQKKLKAKKKLMRRIESFGIKPHQYIPYVEKKKKKKGRKK
jgi:hypothetical protein